MNPVPSPSMQPPLIREKLRQEAELAAEVGKKLAERGFAPPGSGSIEGCAGSRLCPLLRCTDRAAEPCAAKPPRSLPENAGRDSRPGNAGKGTALLHASEIHPDFHGSRPAVYAGFRASRRQIRSRAAGTIRNHQGFDSGTGGVEAGRRCGYLSARAFRYQPHFAHIGGGTCSRSRRAGSPGRAWYRWSACFISDSLPLSARPSLPVSA